MRTDKFRRLSPFYYVINTSNKSMEPLTGNLFAAKVINVKSITPEIILVQTKNDLAHIDSVRFQHPETCKSNFDYERDKWGKDRQLNVFESAELCLGLRLQKVIFDD